MSLWLLPLVGIPGFFAYRAWQVDAAMRSGELMDVRDLLPEREAEIDLRALAGRCYRLELQFEACISQSDVGVDADVDGEDGGDETDSIGASLPYRLSVERSDGAILYERERWLTELFGLAWRASEASGHGRQKQRRARYWGSVPLLDFRSLSLGCLRLDFSIDDRRGRARLEKGQLVLKEGVRRLPRRASLLDRVEIEAEVPRLKPW